MSQPAADSPTRMRIRPYTVTRGRTEAVVDLAVETMIQSTDAPLTTTATREQATIVTLCRDALSIAEISARLELPLQVVKVLVGDLIVDGQVATNTGSTNANGRPDLALLERVLDGLQRL